MSTPTAASPSAGKSTQVTPSTIAKHTQSRTKIPFQAPQPRITKAHTFPRKRPSIYAQPCVTVKQHARELESKLESSLTVAAGGITTLTKNLVDRQTDSKMVKDEQLSTYLTRLRVISEELKGQLTTLGRCSKLSSEQDHHSFELSYRKVLGLWREYQRVSACVVQRARAGKRSGGRVDCDKDDSSRSTVSRLGTTSESTIEEKECSNVKDG